MSTTQHKLDLAAAMGLSLEGLTDVTLEIKPGGPIEVKARYLVVADGRVEAIAKVLRAVQFQEEPA